LVEELRDQSNDAKDSTKPFYRILDANEHVWKAMQRWRQRPGRFLFEKRQVALLYERVSWSYTVDLSKPTFKKQTLY
jgi:hypothetical protein